MPIDDEQIGRIAHLARIAITPEEVATLREDLNRIFAMIERMQAVDATGVVPMSHAQDVVARLREDVVSESDCRALYQSVAPQVENGLYLVPKVIE